MDFSVLSQRTVRASPIRSASVNLAPAVPYHTPIRVRLSTPIVALKKRTRIHYQTDEILYIARTVLFNKTNQLIREIIILFEVYPQLFHKEVLAKPPEWEGQRPRCPRFATVGATRTLPLPGFASAFVILGNITCTSQAPLSHIRNRQSGQSYLHPTLFGMLLEKNYRFFPQSRLVITFT